MNNIRKKRPCVYSKKERYQLEDGITWKNKVVKKEAIFLDFGLDCCEEGSFSVAIIEYENGQLDYAPLHLVKFTDK